MPVSLSGRIQGRFAALGVDEAATLRRADLPIDIFERARAVLEPSAYYDLWRALEAESAVPHVPLRLAQALTPDAFDPAILAALSSADLDAAARRAALYFRRSGPLRLEVTKTPARTRLELRVADAPPLPPGLALAELLFWVALVRLATRAEVRPVRVVVSEPPAALGPYRSWLGVDVGRDEVHAVTFAASDATRRFVPGLARFWPGLAPELRIRLDDLDDDAPASARVRSVLLDRLPAGDATLDGVAKPLHMSGRTLQRRLRSEGLRYQGVLDATREALARGYLTTSTLPVDEIAFLLGYDDPASFYRAFRTWTGTTPEAVRRSGAANEVRAGAAPT